MSNYRMGLLASVILAGTGMMMASAPVARADQPHMMAALQALQTAESELKLADTDKGGHRAKALADVRAAIAEVHAGVGFDRRH